MLIRVLGVVLTLFTVAAAAGDEWIPFSGPYVEPSSPTTGESVNYFVPWDGCGSLWEPTITRVGDLIEILQPINAFCGIPLGGVVHYDLGRFPPGNYRVHIEPCQLIYLGDQCYPGSPPPDVTFSVAGISAQAIPSIGYFAALICAIAVLLMGLRALQMPGR
jgi:hypothetical protein